VREVTVSDVALVAMPFGPLLYPSISLSLLMEQKRPDEALAAYKRSLEVYPRRANSVRGAARAAKVRKTSR
jgi:hypothetical protein